MKAKRKLAWANMQNAKRQERQRGKKGQKDKTSVMGGDKIGKNEKMKGAISTMNNWQANSFLLRVFCGLGAVNIFVDSDASETFYEATFNLQ